LRDEQAGHLQIRLLQAPPLHSGLGTGTQLALAASLAIAQAVGKGDDRQAIIECSGRGRRSAIGIYGFFYGGLIVDGGSEEPQQLGELAARAELPAKWRVLLLRSRQDQHRVCGLEEEACFANSLSPPSVTRILESLLQEELFPAAEKGDFPTFQRAVTTYNRLSGSLFAAAQGGPYRGPVITELVHRIEGLGSYGVGQSSWGPTVFSICEDLDRARWLEQRLAQYDLETQIVEIMKRTA
jgi:beta-RFAP synthase